MKPTLLVSSKVVAEFGPRISAILASAPRPIDLLPFTPALQLTPEQTAALTKQIQSQEEALKSYLSQMMKNAQTMFKNISSPEMPYPFIIPIIVIPDHSPVANNH